MMLINIAKDYTRYPSGRYRKNGRTSGEQFRQDFLETPIKNGESIEIDFDGTIGYGSSFLEEAFGGLVRATKIPGKEILKRLQFKSSDPSLIEEVKVYIMEARF